MPHLTLTAIIPDGATTTVTFVPGDDDRIGDWIASRQASSENIYFQPNVTAQHCIKKPSKREIDAVICRHADIDPADPAYPLAEERHRLAQLANFLKSDADFAATAIIDSGSGIQILWVTERHDLGGGPCLDTWERPERENLTIEHTLGGRGAYNFDRLLRLPGTINFPNAAKRKKGRPITQARLVFTAPNFYTLRDLETKIPLWCQRVSATGVVRQNAKNTGAARAISDIDRAENQDLLADLQKAGVGRIRCEGDLPTKLRKRLKDACAARAGLRNRWAGLVDDLTAAGKDDSRSGADFSLAAILKSAGFTHVEAGLILAAFPHGKSNGDDWRNDNMRLRHIVRCVERSYNPDPRSERQAPSASDLGDVTRFRLDILTKGAPPPRRFLLEPLMPLGTVGLLFGPGGVGKSLVALDLCLRCAIQPRLVGGNRTEVIGPLGGILPEDAGGASVFLTLEDDRAEVHRRTESFDPRGDRNNAPCYVIPAIDLPNFEPVLVTALGRVAVLTEFAKSGLDALLENIARAAGRPVRLLVLDPAGDFLDVDENDATFVKLLMRRLRVVAARYGCTIILLGHVAKSMDVDGPSMRGSSAWVANSRFAYALWPPAAEEAIKLARKLNVPADGLVWGNLVKANHAGAPIGQKRIYLRDRHSGRLVDLTPQAVPERGLSDDELVAMLVDACAEYAEAGMPFAYSGVAGLWNGRADLPDQLATLPKRLLEQLGTQALDRGLLVKARTTHSQGAPKYLDVPDGPLSKGVEIDLPLGSRREALASLKNAGEDGDDVDH